MKTGFKKINIPLDEPRIRKLERILQDVGFIRNKDDYILEIDEFKFYVAIKYNNSSITYKFPDKPNAVFYERIIRRTILFNDVIFGNWCLMSTAHANFINYLKEFLIWK